MSTPSPSWGLGRIQWIQMPCIHGTAVDHAQGEDTPLASTPRGIEPPGLPEHAEEQAHRRRRSVRVWDSQAARAPNTAIVIWSQVMAAIVYYCANDQ